MEQPTRRRPAPPIAPRRGFVQRNFGELYALSQFGFPFAVGPFPTPVARFRALARRARFSRGGLSKHTLGKIAMTLGWPFGACKTSWRTLAQMRAKGETSQSARVFFDMTWLALRHSIPPLEYRLYGFIDPARRAAMHQYVYWNDLPGLGALNRRLGADNRDVQDKDRFAAICAAHGFPHAQTLAVFERGRQVFPGGALTLDAPKLWTKALRLKGGAGGGKWLRDGDGYIDTAGRRLAAPDFIAELAKTDCLLQPLVENHPVIQPITNGALAALRIVTGMNAAGGAEYVTAQMGLPTGGHASTAGGLAASVDPATGLLTRAAQLDGAILTAHPDTGAPIVGVELPFWRESVELVTRAHAAAFSRFAFLGWDVALTPEGPVLLETNSGWGALFHQMADGPLGHTAFSKLVSQYV